MDYLFLLLSIIFLWACTYILFFSLYTPKNLPPAPPSFPIIGNILQLSPTKLHRALSNLSQTYGPIMTVKIGTITTIVISSQTLAKEALQKHDLTLANRFIPQAVQALDHHKSSLIFLPSVCPKWRSLRKFCAMKIFSPLILDSSATQPLREKKLLELVHFVRERSINNTIIDVGEAVFTTVLNLISNTLFSVDVSGFGSVNDDIISKSHNFREVIMSVTLEASKPNIADYLPILRVFDPQGSERRMRKYYQKLFEVFEGVVEERMMQKVDEKYKDALDSFLSLTRMENPEFTHHDMMHLFLDLFIAGVDTTSCLIEWIMAELLHNPEKMIKARKEVEQVIPKDEELIKDSDITKLPYLQAIVKETLRLHPVAPILVHKSEAQVEISGYIVPKEAQVLVNVWAIGRDPTIWANPDVFFPERFLESERDFKGNDFGFIPFGAGRRVCPGIPLAYRVAHTMVAMLIHNFEWNLEDGIKPEDMDMREMYGITLHKVQGLRVKAIPITK